jgi:hypothetical protein
MLQQQLKADFLLFRYFCILKCFVDFYPFKWYLERSLFSVSLIAKFEIFCFVKLVVSSRWFRIRGRYFVITCA